MKRVRKIVRIDPDKCDGCGACVPSCAEGAIQVIDGKARLPAENLCDGLGNCLGTCPQDAITIEQRPAEEFDEALVAAHATAGRENPAAGAMGKPRTGVEHEPHACPGSMLRKWKAPAGPAAAPAGNVARRPSRLSHWPVQLALVPAVGAIWEDADVLIAAQCTAFALPDFHERLLTGKTLAIACPKLDDAEAHVDKLAAIFAANNIQSITVAHMEVPCCTRLIGLVTEALRRAKKNIPLRTLEIALDGTVIGSAKNPGNA